MPARVLGQGPLQGLPTDTAPGSQQRSVRALEGPLVCLVHFRGCTCKSRTMDTVSSACFVVEQAIRGSFRSFQLWQYPFGRLGR
jgi:hypothetical protein